MNLLIIYSTSSRHVFPTLSLTNHRVFRFQNMSWFNHIISEWNSQFQITVAHFVVSDLHKGVKIFAFFRGSRAGLIELQNTKLEKKRMA